MNLLDKNWYGLLILVALTIFSCEDAHDIGLGLDPEGLRLKVLYTEIPLEASNVRIDSIRTSNDVRLLIGKNSNPIFGTTTSTAYSRLTFLTAIPSSSIYDDDLTDYGQDPIVYDSIVFNMDIKKVHSNDILPSQSFEIYQVEDTLFAGAFYLSDFNIPYNSSASEGSFSFNLSESEIGYLEDDSTYLLSFRLNDSMGEKMMAYVKDASISLNASTWYDYKGIAIVPDPANTALIGISPNDSTSIKVHYHIQDFYEESGVVKDSLFQDSLTLDLTLGGSGLYYSQISTDRSGSLMMAENGDYNKFSVNDGNVYLQPASGIFPKVDLTALTDFFNENPNIQVNRMEFAIETQENTNFYNNASNMRFMFVDNEDGSKINAQGLVANQLINTAILTDNGYLSGTSEVLTTELDNTTLTYQGIPTFFGQLVENKTLEIDHAILMPTDITTPDFSVIDEKNGFRIKLYYTLPE
ncbi:MAG: DUF4270 family protein [Reichenbachiella sp.]|uniref:DUF4270 family protein n=1 Tax=Reichenbachiella sp. TaxID=2184521 RepID=UPI003298719E